MRKRVLAGILLFSLLLTGCSSAKIEYADKKQTEHTEYTRETAGIRLEDDFYGYVNFDFLWNASIPNTGFEYSLMRNLDQEIDAQLTAEIRAIAQSSEDFAQGSSEQKIRDFYRFYLDRDAREKEGLKALEGILEKLEKAKQTDEFVSLCGELYTDYGCAVLCVPQVGKDPYQRDACAVSLYPMDFLCSADELLHEAGTCFEIQSAIAQTLKALGRENSDAMAYDIMTMLLDIAESSADLGKAKWEELYHVYGERELQELFGNVDVGNLKKSFGIPDAETVVVLDRMQAKKLNTYLTQENLELWKNYACFRLICEYEAFLSGESGEYLPGFAAGQKKSEEEKAVAAVKEMLSAELESIYIEKHADREKIEAVRHMTQEIAAAFRDAIEDAELDEQTKKFLLRKLDHMKLNIGSDGQQIGSDTVSQGLMQSCIRIKSTAVKENLAAYHSRFTERFEMPQYMVNAYYSATGNSINIPLAVMESPLFDTAKDPYENLGKLGFVIAHEMSHAFDENGIRYDEWGCRRTFTQEDAESIRMEKRKQSFADYFSGYRIMDHYSVDGELTVNENIADVCGLYVLSGMTRDVQERKTLFESYATLWATLSYDDDIVQSLYEDPHSPAEVRVNGVLSALDAFYETYEIGENDAMYVPEENRVRVWTYPKEGPTEGGRMP